MMVPFDVFLPAVIAKFADKQFDVLYLLSTFFITPSALTAQSDVTHMMNDAKNMYLSFIIKAFVIVELNLSEPDAAYHPEMVRQFLLPQVGP